MRVDGYPWSSWNVLWRHPCIRYAAASLTRSFSVKSVTFPFRSAKVTCTECPSWTGTVTIHLTCEYCLLLERLGLTATVLCVSPPTTSEPCAKTTPTPQQFHGLLDRGLPAADYRDGCCKSFVPHGSCSQMGAVLVHIEHHAEQVLVSWFS